MKASSAVPKKKKGEPRRFDIGDTDQARKGAVEMYSAVYANKKVVLLIYDDKDDKLEVPFADATDQPS